MTTLKALIGNYFFQLYSGELSKMSDSVGLLQKCGMTLTPSCELEEIDMYLATNPKEDQGKGGEVALENPKV